MTQKKSSPNVSPEPRPENRRFSLLNAIKSIRNARIAPKREKIEFIRDLAMKGINPVKEHDRVKH